MQLNSSQIAKILPQSYPFLMIDRVVDFKKGESLTAIKNITGNEWMFGSSLMPSGANPEPGRRVEGRCRSPAEQESPWGTTNIFPETLLIEAAAQAAILFYRLNKGEQNLRSKIFLGRAKAEFLKPVHVGDQLKLKTATYKMLETSGYMDIHASVNETDVANLEIMYSVIK